jgi:lysozyme family protein
MTKEFLDVMDFVFARENVVRNGKVVSERDPDDAGGLTKYGVDSRSHPGVDIEGLDKDKALEIYWREWLSTASDKLPWPLSFAYFDACVNMGKSQGAKLLQRVVKTKEDGIIGPATLQAARDATVLPGSAEKLCAQYNQKRRDVYDAICRKNPTQTKFIDGWNNRVSLLDNKINPTV